MSQRMKDEKDGSARRIGLAAAMSSADDSFMGNGESWKKNDTSRAPPERPEPLAGGVWNEYREQGDEESNRRSPARLPQFVNQHSLEPEASERGSERGNWGERDKERSGRGKFGETGGNFGLPDPAYGIS